MKHILIVEDDLNTQEFLKQVVEGAGYRVTLVGDGQAAMEAAIRTQPDLMLLDIMMPEMHGFAVCHRVKSDEALKRIKVVILSSKSFPADRRQADQAGADDYLSKPVTREALLIALRTHVGV